jgi:MOSC domain-containing protein YiiM
MENIKQHNRDIQKKHYYLNIEKNRNKKKLQYYNKFFTKDYINNLIDSIGFYQTIITLKIERLKLKEQQLKNQKEIQPTLTFNF